MVCLKTNHKWFEDFCTKDRYLLHCPFRIIWKSEIKLRAMPLFTLVPKTDIGKKTLSNFGKEIMKILMF